MTIPGEGATKFEYDQLGRLIRTGRPGGYQESYGYDVDGQLISIRTSAGEARWEYDKGRLTEQRDAFGHALRYEYDEAGRVTRVTDETGFWTGYKYDAVGRVSAMKNAAGEDVRLTFDANGRVVAVTESASASHVSPASEEP